MLSWVKLSRARTEVSLICWLLDLLTIKLTIRSLLVDNQSQFTSMVSSTPKVTLDFDYLIQDKLLWVGGWLAGESNNKANLSPEELN